ncbi:RNA polymerase sigma factor [Dinghuibacter silviterrae]|uniref:RNA polymerase sigma-70 factor (ECF subfamily) n=1 Tax=Dinghuibacter silviterrae TaxID=1539049 RepID=A0A4R8DEC3_9BACT|nr:RNA polymerase sigma factor [Dinghuibacter silviterrae]TDW95775.1 RNA polymerase sigma-70 factor (ECF subfamily) [Dinghuibacter silviterrae]
MEVAVFSHTNELVHRSRGGDAYSFQLLYKQYARAMYNTALRILGNTADAEDVLQEAFIDAYKNLSRFEEQSTFGVWLKKIVVYKSINQLRKKKLVLIEPPEVWDKEEPHPGEPDEALLQVHRIREAMERLSPGFRAVLSLYLFEGYDQEEIAGILGVTHATVRTQYIRGKARLLQLIREGGNP